MASRVNSSAGASHSGEDRRIVCTGRIGEGCRTLLVFPQGASNVRCSLCATITAVPSATRTDQLDCGGCRTRLAYQSGASSVRCSLCSTVNAVQGAASNTGGPAHCQCGGCGLTLAYAMGSHSVRCANCSHVTNVNGNDGSSQNSDPFANVKASAMVVVENPPTLDGNGKPRQNMAVGVVCE